MNLSAKEKRIVREFKKRIDETFPDELISLTLFGSRARGEAASESDMDLLAVIRTEDWRLGDRIRELGYALELQHGLVLSIQVMSLQHMERIKKMRTQFFEAVEEEGIVM
ncbi:MAG: nucleotidyltransferase domain-containing protein [Nitrospinae bacterium]|nr:nucleotidyltransferase domain-containing protein [Nitrospinota bacterium]